MNTQLTTVTVVAAVTLSACATAPRTPTTPGGSTVVAARAESSTSVAQDPQRDYSPEALFHEAHGDFLSGMERFKPSIHARFRGLPSAELSSENGNFDSWQIGGDAMVPLITDPDSVVLLGGFFEGRRFENEPAFPVGDENLYEVGLHLGYGQFITDDTYVEGVFSPGVFSDLDGSLKSDDWEFHGRVLGTYRSDEHLFLKGGLEVSDVFEDLAVYPLVGVSWLFSPNWRLDVLLPREIELSYLVDPATTLFVGLALDGREYHRRSSSVTGKVTSNFLTQELDVYLGGLHRFNDHLSAFGRFGASIAGHYEFQVPGATIDGQIEPTIMFEVGVGWDF